MKALLTGNAFFYSSQKKRFMKSIVFILMLCATGSLFAQSESFSTLRNKFRGEPNVVHLNANGLLAKAVLAMAGERDFKKSIKHVRSVRLVTVPKESFKNAEVSVPGFRNILRKDSFVELTTIKDHGDDVSLYLQEAKKKKHNRYFILINEDHQVTGIEIKGYIDPSELAKHTASAKK
jgi:hypothetical protein